ncbi:PREDICTED: uncharacterized protein LOC103343005 [Prunus mume]|uniref:Uncharacterized protein LOC103343005 n=1 Tax=Prunus mume TaxID=102107 RepID=A0ABM0PV03_PRUMU|nr:PREDICTED: uncharacterized protein LOC103343005 [Prunus mume]
MARKGHSGGSANAPHPVRAGGSQHMSMARSQVTSATVALAQGAQKRRAEEPLPREAGRRRLEEEPRRDLGKRPVSSTTAEVEKRASRDPVTRHLEPWVDAEMVIGSYQEAVKQMLRVDVVEGLFTEEMGYSGMTLSALEDQMKATLKLFVATQNVAAHREFDRGQRDEQAVTVAKLNRTIGEKAKVEEELGLVWGRLEAEMKKNAELLSLVNLVKSQRELDEAKSQRELDEAKQKIEALSFKLQSCYDDAVKDYIQSAEYQEKLDNQRVEGYFDLIEKVGEKYPAINWSFLDNEAKEASAEVVKGGRGCPEC